MTNSADSQALRVYCAGPLFNESERREMTRIADTLCEAGYSVYLPHRDGMEFRLVIDVLVQRGWDRATAGQFLHAAIFALDVFQLAVECDCLVWNLNGRVPDEGAVSEAAMAWTLGKPIVAFQDDVRSLISGRVNPLLVGLVEFQTVGSIEQIPEALSQAISHSRRPPPTPQSFPPKMQRAIRDGRKLWNCLCETAAFLQNDRIADCVTDLFAPTATQRE